MTSSVAKLFGGTALRGGSPKQRAWAEEIRAERLRGMSPEAAEMVCDPKGVDAVLDFLLFSAIILSYGKAISQNW